MNETIQTLLSHRSIRKYKNISVPDEILNKILECGSRASTTGNMQLYSVIITKDEKNKEAIAPFHFNQAMVKEAPVILTFCADINRFSKWCKQRNAEPCYDNFLWFINAAIDAVLVAQNVCIAAESYGLGICYLGTTVYMADKFIEFFKLPKGVVPITAITLGYAAEDPDLTDRLPFESTVHYEIYKDYSANAIDEIYKEKESLSLTKKLIEENKTENLAQVFTNCRYKKDDNLYFSKQFLKVLQKQGFLDSHSIVIQ